MNEQDALEAQQALVEDTLPLVFQTYDGAIAEGVATPVVVVLNCEDPLGGEIARGWLGDEVVEEAIALHHAESPCEGEDGADSEPAVFARAVDWDLCREELSEAFPYLASVFKSTAPDDGVLVISVTAGGASALTAPFSAR